MKNITVRQCVTCQNIGSHTAQLAADLRNDPNVKVERVTRVRIGGAEDGRQENTSPA